LNDSEALNNLGLMVETGFEDRLADPEQALDYYKKANKLGNTDAAINIAVYYVNGVHVERDAALGKQLLKQAYKNGNEKAADYMVTFGFIRSRKEMEAEMLNTADEEIVSQMA
jgi:TPR repeat protein